MRDARAEAGQAVFGRRAVLELLRSGHPVHRLYVADGARGLEALLGEARALGVPVQRLPRARLEALCGSPHHQGVAALTAVAPYIPFEDLLERLRQAPGAVRMLVLDHVEDPQNLGSLLRTADAAGVAGVVTAARRAAGLTPAVWKASAGAAAHVPVARVSSVAAALEQLKQAGWWAVGADPEAPVRLWEGDLRGRVALVVGAEGRGLSELVRRRCDVLVSIPMGGRLASLNAAVAGSLLMYEAVRQETVSVRAGALPGARPQSASGRGLGQLQRANPRPDGVS